MTNGSVVIFDLEYTAWEGSNERDWSHPGEFREIVQIGAISIDGVSLEEQEVFDCFVRPRINPDLSDYFINLTGITNEDVKRHGVDLSDAHRHFSDFLQKRLAFAYGNDDEIMAENVALYDLVLGAPNISAVNLRHWFKDHNVPTDDYVSGEVAQFVGAPINLSAHNAVNDVRSIIAAVKHLVGQGAENPFTQIS